jgi:amino acid transporter
LPINHAQPALRRGIGPLGSAMLALNGMIGAGIFALPAALAADFGAFSPFLFLIFGALVFLIAVPLARLAALTPETGGPIVAVRQAFGPFAAFEVGWTYYVARLTALAANAVIFADYAGRLAPAVAEPPWRATLIIAMIAAVAAPNILGVRRAAMTLNVISALKVLPLIALAAAAISSAGGLAASAPPPAESYGPAALLVLYAFVGFEAILIPAGETRRAETVIPRALLLVIGGTALFYFLVVAGYVAVMGEAPQPEAPLAALAQSLFGPVGALVILLVALASIAGNLLSNLLATPRVTFALAEQGALPGWYARVSARFQTPANSIAFMGAAAAALAVSGSFVELAVVSTLARLVVYVASLAALPVLGARARLLRFESVANAVFAAVWAAGIFFCLWSASQSTLAAWRMLGLLLLVGSGLYVIATRRPPEVAPVNRKRS